MFKIVLIDQRGCGKSTPFASLKENTTWDLVSDMERVREEANISKWILFGGSWGSTLAIVYAQEHPDRVQGLILRGIFLSRACELRWLYEREGVAMLYPEAFKRYVRGLPADLQNSESLMKAYYSILSREQPDDERRTAANAWSQWELTLSSFPRGNSSKEIDDFSEYSEEENLAFARIEAHYFYHDCFFDRDGFLLSEERISKIRHIKTCIVQGRFDMVTPRKTAYDLADRLDPNRVQTIIIENAGHSTFEPGIEQALLKIVAEFAHEFRQSIAKCPGR